MFQLPGYFQAFFVRGSPIERVVAALHLRKQLAGEDVIVLVILDEKDFNRFALHFHFPRSCWRGRSTISNQYRPSPFMTSTRPSKVTGLLMNELAPES